MTTPVRIDKKINTLQNLEMPFRFHSLRPRPQGFTLIEMMMVMGMMTVVLLGTTQMLTNFTRNQLRNQLVNTRNALAMQFSNYLTDPKALLLTAAADPSNQLISCISEIDQESNAVYPSFTLRYAATGANRKSYSLQVQDKQFFSSHLSSPSDPNYNNTMNCGTPTSCTDGFGFEPGNQKICNSWNNKNNSVCTPGWLQGQWSASRTQSPDPNIPWVQNILSSSQIIYCDRNCLPLIGNGPFFFHPNWPGDYPGCPDGSNNTGPTLLAGPQAIDRSQLGLPNPIVLPSLLDSIYDGNNNRVPLLYDANGAATVNTRNYSFSVAIYFQGTAVRPYTIDPKYGITTPGWYTVPGTIQISYVINPNPNTIQKQFGMAPLTRTFALSTPLSLLPITPTGVCQSIGGTPSASGCTLPGTLAQGQKEGDPCNGQIAALDIKGNLLYCGDTSQLTWQDVANEYNFFDVSNGSYPDYNLFSDHLPCGESLVGAVANEGLSNSKGYHCEKPTSGGGAMWVPFALQPNLIGTPCTSLGDLSQQSTGFKRVQCLPTVSTNGTWQYKNRCLGGGFLAGKFCSRQRCEAQQYTIQFVADNRNACNAGAQKTVNLYQPFCCDDPSRSCSTSTGGSTTAGEITDLCPNYSKHCQISLPQPLGVIFVYFKNNTFGVGTTCPAGSYCMLTSTGDCAPWGTRW